MDQNNSLARVTLGYVICTKYCEVGLAGYRNKRGHIIGGPNCGTHHLVTIKLECRSAWPGYCMEQSWFWQKYQMTSHMSWRRIGTAASFFRQDAHMP